MDSERLKQIEEIYHAVLDVPYNQRDSFFRERCGEDFELRREVESLLLYEKTFDSVIDAPPESIVAEIFSYKPNPSLINSQINQYKILSLLGEGGMGAVYLAQDTTLERKVAIKFLSNEFAEDSNKRNRFFQEAKAASALNHPNILTVHEIGESNGTHFIVTELINGRTLMQYLKEEKPPLKSVIEIAVQIASALSAAHEAGIIHRDIKPENVMVRNDGIVKVLDFGIAKLTDTSVSAELDKEAVTRMKSITTPGMIIGTPQYMSPEQARGQKVDLRSDIFSFGVVLYEMISGKKPFSGSTNIDILGSILRDDPKPLSEHQSDISPNLEHIVGKAIRKDREQRYQHIKDLLIDLNDLKKTFEADGKPVNYTDSTKAIKTAHTTTDIVTQRRFSLIHALIFLLVAGGLIAAAWWFLAPSNINQIGQLKTAEVVSWRSAPGEVYSIGSFSPDGKVVAFTSTKVGAKNIWIKQTSSGDAVQITNDEYRNDSPIWSANGEEIAFFSLRGNLPGIWRMPYLTGSPTLIKTLGSGDGSVKLKYWSKKDTIYYELNQNLFALDVKTGQTTKLTDFDSSVNFNTISISFDEEHISYVTTDKDERQSIWVMSLLRGGSAKQIFSTTNEIKNTTWHPDNRRLFYSSNVEGIYQIFVTDINGSNPLQITSGDRDSFVLDVSSDGAKVLYGSTKEESDVWGVNVDKGEEFAFASDIDSELWASVSPDNKTVAFQSIKNLSQGNNLFSGAILTKQSATEQSRHMVANGFLPTWSPDGKQLAFIRLSGNKYNLRTIKTTGGEEKLLTANDVIPVEPTLLPYNRTEESNFSWSPDSSRIAYYTNKSGARNIWLAAADGSNDTQVTNNNDANLFLYCPVWSSDGKRIAYSSKSNKADVNGKKIYATYVVDVETKTSKTVYQSENFQSLLGWSQSEKELILATGSRKNATGLPTETNIIQVDTETGKERVIANLASAYFFNIHLSFDRKMIAFAANRDDKDNIWIIPSTGGEARKITGNSDSRLYFSSISWSPDGKHIYFGKQSRFSLLSMITNFK